MTAFPDAKDCHFLTPQAEIRAPLPPFIELDRRGGGKLLAFVYKHKTYTLGISKGDGWLCGFRGALRDGKRAEIIILKKPEADGGGYLVYDARSTTDAAVERDLFRVPVYDPTLNSPIPFPAFKPAKARIPTAAFI